MIIIRSQKYCFFLISGKLVNVFSQLRQTDGDRIYGKKRLYNILSKSYRVLKLVETIGVDSTLTVFRKQLKLVQETSGK